MNYILFDGTFRNNLLPFTFTRPVADLRIGILTIREKWEQRLNLITSTKTEEYLSEKWPLKLEGSNIFINASVLPDDKLLQEISALQHGEKLVFEDILIAYKFEGNSEPSPEDLQLKESSRKPFVVAHTWDIFSKNAEAIQLDFDHLTKGRTSQMIDSSNYTKVSENIFIEEGASVENCSLNASDGPIYIGKNATVMEGSLIKGLSL